MISSSITFLYYEDFLRGVSFFEEVLELSLVMDQGFARVYKVTETSFLGMVKKEKREKANDTLFSFTVDDVDAYYDCFKKKDVLNLTEIIEFDIPLKSFFFEDFEGHKFEIQEFVKKEDKLLF